MGLIGYFLMVLMIAAIAAGINASLVLWLLLVGATIVLISSGGLRSRLGGRI
jgi:hypothetical protein